MSKKKEGLPGNPFRTGGVTPGPENLEQAIQHFSSNLYALLIKNPEAVRFLRVVQRAPWDWFAVLAAWDKDGLPIVCFGNGVSYASALWSLGKSLAGHKWTGDKYAPKPGEE